MANDRDCENCKHHKEVCKDGIFYHSCESWDCEFEPKEDEEFEPKEDAISRQAVLKIIDGWYEQNRDTDNIEDLIVLITYMDSVNPQKPICPSAGVDCEDCPAYEPKTGHWIFDEILDRHYYCSECKSMGVDYWDYCPYCGAKMVEPQESEKINCKTTKCENCQNHNYCDYEPQESEEKPKSECEHDHEILKAYSDGASAVLNKIIADIKQAYDDCDITNDYDRGRSYGLYMAMQIIDSYMTEEGKA